MALTEAQKAAFLKWVIDTLSDPKTQSEITKTETEKGIPYNVGSHISLLQGKETTRATEEGKIVALQEAIQKQNKVANAALDEGYKSASNEIDSLVGFFGKDSKFAGILRNKRDSMVLEKGRGPETPPTPPTPPIPPTPA